MTDLVVDSSAIGIYLLPDEDADLLPGLTEALANWRLVVPPHWHFEVANLALVSTRRQRLQTDELPALAANLCALEIEVDSLDGSNAWGSVMTFALACGLTIYDAAYLALAKRRHLPLATLDAELSAAARETGVTLFGR